MALTNSISRKFRQICINNDFFTPDKQDTLLNFPTGTIVFSWAWILNPLFPDFSRSQIATTS
jgi:hypothetical protein